jgi:4-hydroxybenzoate polyprenyltransferase
MPIRTLLEMIKFEHTVFALPFALMGAVLAVDRGVLPSARVVGWILVAMVGARSAAMAFNRIVDARYDALNPRTAARAIPAGLLTVGQVAVFTLLSVAVFEVAAAQLNRLCLILSPVALLAVLGYSYTKRFTSLSHLALGIADGIAPIGAWVAVTGRIELVPILLGVVVALWIGGFDIIYALQDLDFDRQAGLHSLPKALGPGPALLVSRAMHAIMLWLLAAIGVLAGLHWIYFAGVAGAAGLIVYEQCLVSPNDLRRVNLAFFTLNGWIGVLLLACLLADRIALGR